MRVLLFSGDERWMRHVETGFRMCREDLEPLEVDGRRTETEFWESLDKRQYDVIIMQEVPQQRASWDAFFRLIRQGWREMARRKEKYIWHFGRTSVALAEEEICYIRSRNKAVSVYTADGSYRITTSMKREEERLPKDRFVRISRDCLVNVGHIRRMEGREIILANGVRLPVSVRRRGDVLRQICGRTGAEITRT